MLTRRALLGLFGGTGLVLFEGCASSPRLAEAAAPPSPSPRPSPRMDPPLVSPLTEDAKPAATTEDAKPALEDADLAKPALPDAPRDAKADLPKLDLPPRPKHAKGGRAFYEATAHLSTAKFEDAAIEAFAAGNAPSFMRTFARITTSLQSEGRTLSAEAFVLRDYFCVGEDDDFLRVPLTAGSAQRLADRFGCLLPTRKIVNLIFAQAETYVPPRWIDGGPDNSDRRNLLQHQADEEEARLANGGKLGGLVAGPMKDVVLSNRVLEKPGRIAIYGWHKRNGKPIQPLSNAHGTKYVDYSHGIRLVLEAMRIDGREAKVRDVLADEDLAELLSDEGAIQELSY